MANQQPCLLGEESPIQRALTRARSALHNAEGDYALGFAEGVMICGEFVLASAWCAAVEKSGMYSVGGGSHIQLPEELASAARRGDLTESQIEAFLEENIENPYEELVEHALVGLKLQLEA